MAVARVGAEGPAYAAQRSEKMLEGAKLVIRTQDVGSRLCLLLENVIRAKQKTLMLLYPVKSAIVRNAEDMGPYDIPVKDR